MSRMRDALQVLEERRHAASAAARVDATAEEPFEGATAKVVEHPLPRRYNAYEVCSLPVAARVDDSYLDLARSISEQGAANYCNVVLIAAPDTLAVVDFSLTQAAQALTLQSVGNVLVV